MSRPYFTLCIRDEDRCFYDQFGSTDRKEVKAEREFAYDGYPRSDWRIIETDGTSAQLIAALETLNKGN